VVLRYGSFDNSVVQLTGIACAESSPFTDKSLLSIQDRRQQLEVNGDSETDSVSLTYRPVQRAMSSGKWHKQLPFRVPSASRSLGPHQIPVHSLGASEAL
jgi:hypothetical protein